MTAAIQRRLAALEGSRGGVCLACEFAKLNREAKGEPAAPNLPCLHPRRSLAQELTELDAMLKEQA